MASRFSGPEYLRVYHKALDLLFSTTPESENELLDMVRKAKREQDREVFHPPKKLRTARAGTEVEGATKGRAASRSASEQVVPGPASSVNAQPKAIGTTRSGSGTGVARGRVEKPKRKSTR